MHGKKKKGKKAGYGSTSAKPTRSRGSTRSRSTGRTATSSRRRTTAASKKKKTGY